MKLASKLVAFYKNILSNLELGGVFFGENSHSWRPTTPEFLNTFFSTPDVLNSDYKQSKSGWVFEIWLVLVFVSPVLHSLHHRPAV